MNRSVFKAAFPAILSLFLTGCLIKTENAITPDPKVRVLLTSMGKYERLKAREK